MTLPSRLGYSPAQAERLKHRADVAMAKIEDQTAELRHILSDFDIDRIQTQLSADLMLDEFRGIVHGIKKTIDRRTQIG